MRRLGVITSLALSSVTLLSLANCVWADQAADSSSTAPASATDSASLPGLSKTQPDSGPSVAVEGGFMVPYTMTIPGSSVQVEMIPVPGGTFSMGSPEGADDAQEDEQPALQVTVGPMWVAKYETSWGEYNLFMSMYKLLKVLQSQGLRQISDDNRVDAITAPTELYDSSFTYQFGQDANLPAVTMTQYAAKQYTKWLSLLTGQQLRLPTAAEWEHACRAGSTTNYSFGDDPEQLDEFAWYVENADETPHAVGQKQPNAFGLHDMHGNVMEWCIDSYTEDGYTSLADKPQPLSLSDAIIWPETFDNRVVRGGSWQDDAEQLRSAARLGSADEDWKANDPNFPLSPWWYTDDPARGVGFRIVRSYQPLDDALITKFYEIDNEDIQMDVDMRLNEGRGVLSPIDPALAEDIKQAN
ncbi:MAG: formylglycine-generating enzyme family protein [Pirellulaceae bacterium]|jgi:sulfatase modifying factor 1|nr:formylglycine-generating enzyme family protein [Pirellulaceae bacterium]